MIDSSDYPYSIYKSSDGDELLDAHNDIIAVFDPHTEPEIERMVAAAPEMYEMLNKLRMEMDNLSFNLHTERDIEYAEDTRDSIHALLRRIEGEEENE